MPLIRVERLLALGSQPSIDAGATRLGGSFRTHRALDLTSVARPRRARTRRLRGREGASQNAIVVMRAESDEQLMVRVGQGDRQACQRLVERHLSRIHAFATRVLGNDSEGEDVAQEVFLRLWKHAGRWRPTGAKLTTWLHRITLNLCLNKKQRSRETPSELAMERADDGPEPAEVARRRDLENHVNEALAELPTNQRAAITLCHYQGMRNAEAAEVLGVSVDALESLLARGRRGMKKRLAAVAADLLEGGPTA